MDSGLVPLSILSKRLSHLVFMYISLEDIKKQLNIDEYFTDDDNYLMSLVDACENAVSRHIDRPLSTLEDDNGNLPPALKQATMLLVGNFYNNREADAYSTVVEVPLGYRYLLDLFMDYKKKCY